MLLNIYIGSVILFYIGYTIYVIDVANKVKSSGVKKSKAYKSFQLRYYVQLFIFSLIPIYNAYLGLFYIFSKSIYEAIDTMIENLKNEVNDSVDK